MKKGLKKMAKARAKARKKEAKRFGGFGKSRAVKFAESVKGIIYLVLAVSLVISLVLSNQGYIVTRGDIIGSLFSSLIGKIVLAIIGVAFFIYGLKKLGAVK